MKPAMALAAAIASAALAVALVGMDLAFNVNVHLETRNAQGEWVTWASGDQDDRFDSPYPAMEGRCAGPEMRLVVHNDQPFSTSGQVRVDYNSPNATGNLVREDLSLGAGESRTFEFTVPARAFDGTTNLDGLKSPWQVSVSAQYGRDTWLNACVQAEAPQ